MKNRMLKLTVLGLFTAVLAATANVRAQDAATNAPAANDQPAPVKHRKHDHSVFNGKLTAVDKSAMTLTVGERTFAVTSDTKITKDGKPATLADGVVGETVGGAYKKSADGKLTATTVHFGAKAEKKKKHTAPAGTADTTNSVPN